MASLEGVSHQDNFFLEHHSPCSFKRERERKRHKRCTERSLPSEHSRAKEQQGELRAAEASRRLGALDLRGSVGEGEEEQLSRHPNSNDFKLPLILDSSCF